MRFQFSTLLLALRMVATLLAAPIAAEEEKADAAREVCRDEIENLCPDSKPGGAERRQCIREKGTEFSEGCRRKLMHRGNPAVAGIEGLRVACGDEIDLLCDEVRRGSGRMLRCLGSKDETEISEKCRAYLDFMSRMRETRKAAGE